MELSPVWPSPGPVSFKFTSALFRPVTPFYGIIGGEVFRSRLLAPTLGRGVGLGGITTRIGSTRPNISNITFISNENLAFE